MIEQLELEVQQRQESGKNAARRLRACGKAPAVLYGLNTEPEPLSVDTKTITRILSHPELRNRVINLKGGAEGPAMAGDYQIDPVTHALLHVDIRRVDLSKKIKASVPLIPLGVPYGVKTEGGLEDVILREALVECLPSDLPEKIEFDVTQLNVGDAVRIRDLQAGENVEFLSQPNTVVVRVVGRKSEEEEEAEAAAAEQALADAAAAESAESEENSGDSD
jgi:large subunit ribosomal protein L25